MPAFSQRRIWLINRGSPNSVLHETEHPFVTETAKEILQVRLQHPAHLTTGDHLIEGGQGLMGSSFRPATKRTR